MQLEMSNICINTLIGIPASGKSTFSQKVQSQAKIFNVIHICYDDFIQMPDIGDSSIEASFYFQSKQYKKQRFSVLWLIKQLIDDIQEDTKFSKFNEVLSCDFPHVTFDIKVDSTKEYYLLIIDDTMHYKSMRKEIRTLARNHQVGYFVTFFHSTLDSAISRNQNRLCSVDEKHLKRMCDIFEPPADEVGDIIHINIDDDHEITVDFVELFALKCMKYPLRIVHSVESSPMEQSTLHKVDLILRKSINGKMKKSKEFNTTVKLNELAKVLCAKRLFLLNEIKMGRIVLPENLDDLSCFID